MRVRGGIELIRSERILKRKVTNLFHSALLMIGMLGLLAAMGWFISAGDGLFWLMTLGLCFLLIGPRVSPRLVLRLYNARPLSPHSAPSLFRIVARLAESAGLPTPPTLYYVPSGVINAFAVGGSNEAAIGVTDGLLRTLDQEELVGVLAHEISHIRSSDLWVMGLADAVSRLTGTLSWIGQLLLLINLPMLLLDSYQFPWLLVLLLIAAPTISSGLQLALSRAREFDADLDAARLTGNPRGLARALAKMERLQRGWLQRILLPGRQLPEPSLFRTHPDTNERIRRLLELEGGVARIERPERGYYRPYREAVILPSIPLRGPRWRMSGLCY